MVKPVSPHTRAVTETVLRTLQGEPDPARLEMALRQLGKWRAELIANTIAARSGTQVLSGPFKGMDYNIRASEGSRAARMIGAYEASLGPVIEKIVATGYGLVIDVGSAEGYYAVGLARRMPKAVVWARDENPKAQALCQALAQANGVSDRVLIGGLMQHEDFAVCAQQNSLVLCDIEGAEAELLDPVRARGLLAADILVETHDTFVRGLAKLIAARFRATHHVRLIGRHLDDTGLPAWMEEFSDMDRLLALWEWRGGPTPWLWMVRK